MSNELHTDHKTMMQDIWSQIEKWMQANAPQVLDTLQPGASDAQIAGVGKSSLYSISRRC